DAASSRDRRRARRPRAPGAQRRIRTPLPRPDPGGLHPKARLSAALPSIVAPEHLAPALVARQYAREDEQQVREPVEVTQYLRVDRLSSRQRPCPALGAPRNGAAQMTGRRSRAPPGENELLQRRQWVVEPVERLLEPFHVRRRNDDVTWNAELGAQIEQLMLHLRQHRRHSVWQPSNCQQHSEDAVQLIDSPVCLYTRTVLRHPRAVTETGRAVVTRTRVDLAEPVAHGSPPRMQSPSAIVPDPGI